MRNRVLLIVLAISTCTCFAQARSNSHHQRFIIHQLGSPVSIDEAEIGRDFLLKWAVITNQSDRPIESVTLACLEEGIDGGAQVVLGSAEQFKTALVPNTSEEISNHINFPQCNKGPHLNVVFFVARAKYQDNSEYAADLAAIQAEFTRRSKPKTANSTES
jgi:hypothetical protein